MTEPATPAPEPTTPAQDTLAAALAALLPIGAGLLVLLGWRWIGGVGALLGAGGAVWWGYWWHTKHGSFFPKDLQGGSVGRIALLVALLALMFTLAV